MSVKYVTLIFTMAILSNNAFNPKNGVGDPLVKTEGGLVRGRFATSFSGRGYASFQGIPYARPPVGNLRFKAPQPAEPWGGELDASSPGHDCPQLQPRSGSVVGSEDCLTLNVYTSQLEGSPQPVLVWVHGGSFINGSGRLYQPDVLLGHQLVVVTLNYRLGALGFLCWPEAGVPGNMGLRDQSLALSWVRRNIAAFGGDAGSVTLAGQSAGGACVVLHMLSPLSAGLFDRVVCMSGSALCQWAKPADPVGRAQRLLRAVGLPAGSDPAAVAAFLQGPAAGPDVLVPRYREALHPQEQVEALLPALAACVESEAGAEAGATGDAFLPAEPWQLLAAGRFQRVPVLAGLTDGEAKFFMLHGGLGSKASLEAFDKNFEHFFSSVMDAASIDRIRNFYFGSEPITEKLLVNVSNLLADVHVVEPLERTLRLVAARSPPPAFLYLLSHQPRHSFWGTPLHQIDSLGVPGVPHGEDLWALFPLLPGEPAASRRVPGDDWVRLYFATAVANFARTGSPVPKTDELMKETWPPFTLENQAFMNISSRPTMQQNIMADRIQFWRKLLADLETKTKSEVLRKHSNESAPRSKVQFLLKIFICTLMLAVFFE